MFEERLQQRALGSGLLQRASQLSFQSVQVLGDEVGQVTILALPSDLFDRVQIGGVGRQPFEPDPACEAVL